MFSLVAIEWGCGSGCWGRSDGAPASTFTLSLANEIAK